MPDCLSCPSPNHNARPAGRKVKYLILHYTGMATGEAALARLCDPDSRVSAHYLIEEDGRCFALVDEDRRAWHAGVAAWESDSDINGLSVGIELVNPGHDSPGYSGDYRPFPKAQMRALRDLCREILARHDIRPWHILGHSDVAPGRKVDPGELFDWPGLAAEGIGLWPGEGGAVLLPQNLAALQQNLKDYGYAIQVTSALDQQTRTVVEAFQRHFRPARIDGVFDEECGARLLRLLALKKY